MTPHISLEWLGYNGYPTSIPLAVLPKQTTRYWLCYANKPLAVLCKQTTDSTNFQMSTNCQMGHKLPDRAQTARRGTNCQTGHKLPDGAQTARLYKPPHQRSSTKIVQRKYNSLESPMTELMKSQTLFNEMLTETVSQNLSTTRYCQKYQKLL